MDYYSNGLLQRSITARNYVDIVKQLKTKAAVSLPIGSHQRVTQASLEQSTMSLRQAIRTSQKPGKLIVYLQ